MPKAVVDVILDRKVDELELIDAVLADTGPTKARTFSALKKLFASKGAPEAKQEIFRTAYRILCLGLLAKHAPEAMRLALESLRAELKAVQAVGADKVRSIPAIRKAEVMARQAERKGLTGGAKGQASDS